MSPVDAVEGLHREERERCRVRGICRRLRAFSGGSLLRHGKLLDLLYRWFHGLNALSSGANSVILSEAKDPARAPRGVLPPLRGFRMTVFRAFQPRQGACTFRSSAYLSAPPMPPHELIISTGDIDSGGKQYRFPLRAAWIRGILEDHEATATDIDGVLDIRASKSGTDVVVHGTLEAALTAPCARCLEPVRFDVREPVSVLYAPRPAVSGRETAGEREISADEADTLPYDGETVVLDDLVRDELILQTPSFPLCSEDCPGISPSFQSEDGKKAPDRDIDPRLLPLKRILESKE